jgi:capsule polysaccharide modification protein KpsS
MLHELARRRVLMLQGPPGPFFRLVADELEALGARVRKVNFNPGDDLFFRGPNVTRFRGTMDSWPAHLERLLTTANGTSGNGAGSNGTRGTSDKASIDAIVLFGDCRPVHRDAIEVAEKLGVEVYVFEEGYLRPDFITLERDGVNGRSRMPRDPNFYRRANLKPRKDIDPVGHVLFYAAYYSWLYAFACNLGGWRYPHYRHHKQLNIVRHMLAWSKAALRKLAYTARERRLFQKITSDWQGRYFLVPLQCHHDYQLLSHSGFKTIDDFMALVVASFAEHAKPDDHLVFKHHPLDRAYTNYAAQLSALAVRHRVSGRIHYLHDEHLPTLIKHARGTIVINSTVGLSSVHHGTPVKCLGVAVYDMPGLTFQGGLDHFWRAKTKIDPILYRRFRSWLEHNNQLNGNIWKRSVTRSGLRRAGTSALSSLPSSAVKAPAASALSDGPPLSVESAPAE